MPKKPDDTDKPEKDKPSDKLYRDYDLYDWSGKQTDKGPEVRKKGTDR